MTGQVKKLKLSLSANDHLTLSGARNVRCEREFEKAGTPAARVTILFLAELIECLGNNYTAEISYESFKDPDDAGSFEWRLYNEAFSIYRKLIKKIYVGRSKPKIEEDVTNIVCTPYDRMSIEWNGEYAGGGGAMKLTIDGVTENEAAAIEKIAGEIFKNVEIEKNESENFFGEPETSFEGERAEEEDKDGRRAQKAPKRVEIGDIYTAAKCGGLEDVIRCAEKGDCIDKKNAETHTPLMLVCMRTDERDEIAEYLLEKGANARTGNQYKKSALIAACENGHAEIVKMLLKKGAATQSGDIIGTLAIHAAANNGHADVIRILLENKALPDVKDGNKYTAMHLAAMRGYTEAVRALVEGGASVTKKDSDGRTAMDIAKDNKFDELAAYLESVMKLSPEERRAAKVKQEVCPSGADNDKADCGAALVAAAARSDRAKIKELIAAGADINFRKNNGQTALSITCSRINCDMEILELLLSAGAKTDISDKSGNAPIHFAAEKNNVEVIEKLALAGCDPNLRNNSGETALYTAAFARNLEACETLVKFGADISIITENGRDALIAAAAAGDERIAMFLLSRGADAKTSPESGWNALIYCAYNGLNRPAAEMIKRGANVNCKSGDGKTPLIYAIKNKNESFLEALIAAGADPEIEDDGCMNAVDHARLSWNQKIILKTLSKNCGPKLQEAIEKMEFIDEKLAMERERQAAEHVAEYKRNNAPGPPPLPSGFQPSVAFRNFYESFFGDPYMAWHDGLDMGSVDQLTGDERDLAEKLLLEHGDHRASAGLGQLKSNKSAEILKKNLLTASALETVNICVALKKIENDDGYCKYIIQVLKRCPSEYDRLEAAMALRDFNTAESIAALYETLHDPDYLVRYHACNSLLKLHGINSDISEYADIFSKIITKDGEPVTEEISKRFEAAGEDLKKIFGK